MHTKNIVALTKRRDLLSCKLQGSDFPVHLCGSYDDHVTQFLLGNSGLSRTKVKDIEAKTQRGHLVEITCCAVYCLMLFSVLSHVLEILLIY